eukprot:Hpha_TRINITY_DN16232_c3_g1::TRINITY_DN16232_c3_g1_i2::g.14411::m.14411
MGEMMQGGDRVNLPEGEMRVMRVRCVSKKNAIRMDKIFWLSSQFGVVERMSRSVKHLKTYDFVQFQSVDACEEAIQYLNSKMLVDGKLSCEKSDHPELTFNNCTSSSWDCKAENNALKTLFETLKEATRKEARDWLLERLNQKQSRLVGGCNSFGPLMPNGAATLSENLIPYANVWGQQRFGDGPLYPTADSIAHSVVVHGCSAGITNADLYKLFSMSGNVKHVYNGKQEGVRVVQFQTQEECESVGDLMMLHGPLSLLGSKVTVEVGGPCRETTMSGGYQGSPVPFLKGVEQHTPSRILWLWGVPKPVQVPVCIAHGGKTQPGVLLVTPEAVVARFPSGVEVLRLSTSSVSRVDFDFKDAKDAQGVQLFHLGTQPPHLLSLAASRVELGQMLAGMGHASSKQVVRTESKVWESLGPEARTQMLKPEWAFDRESPAAREEMENEMGGMVKRLFSTVTGFGGRGAAAKAVAVESLVLHADDGLNKGDCSLSVRLASIDDAVVAAWILNGLKPFVGDWMLKMRFVLEEHLAKPPDFATPPQERYVQQCPHIVSSNTLQCYTPASFYICNASTRYPSALLPRAFV